MMCFRDRSYCPFWENCKKGVICDRALTQKVKDDAEEWWGSPNAPIDVYTSNPKCFEVK